MINNWGMSATIKGNIKDNFEKKIARFISTIAKKLQKETVEGEGKRFERAMASAEPSSRSKIKAF